MENTKDIIGFSCKTKSYPNTPPQNYNGELEESKLELQNKINELVKDYELKHRVTVNIEKDVTKKNRYHIYLFINLDWAFYE